MEKINKYETALASIHIAKSLNASHTSQNLSKSMFAPTLKNEKKIKHENTTMCIVHSTLRDATTPYTDLVCLELHSIVGVEMLNKRWKTLIRVINVWRSSELNWPTLTFMKRE